MFSDICEHNKQYVVFCKIKRPLISTIKNPSYFVMVFYFNSQTYGSCTKTILFSYYNPDNQLN